MISNNPVIITGGGQRLGLATALELNKRGYKVVITYRKDRPLLSELEEQGITCVAADFSTDSGIKTFINEVQQRFSVLRAIIHNASTWSRDPKPYDTDEGAAVLDAMMQVHVKAPLLINKALAKMLEDNGDILHISDQVATIGSFKHMAYAASKAAIENLTMSFARGLAPRIKVNAIAPALITFNDWDDAEYRKKALQKSLLGVEPGEQCFTDTVLYLLQTNYVTGRVLPLDGGRHLKLP
ncbi:dihydromonapterin reductase [Planctobacterium marinum]